MKRFC